MAIDWNNMTKIKKGYLILSIINLVYGVGLTFCYMGTYEPLDSIWFVFGVLYYLTQPVYLIIYGILSYKLTEKLTIPHAILFVALTFPALLTVAIKEPLIGNWSLLGKILNFLIFNLGILLVSLICALITKVITKAYRKRKNVPPAQPPQKP